MPDRKKAARSGRRRRFYAVPFMISILIVALALTGLGRILRMGLLSGLPQYIGVPDLAIPMMLLKDSGPLREARQRVEWEAQHAAADVTAQPSPDPTAAIPTPLPATPAPVTAAPATPTPLPPTPAPITPEPATPEPTAEPIVVDESYFDHTLFIGDSRTDHMRLWGRVGKAQYFCGTSYSVYNIFDKRATDLDFSEASLDWVLSHYTYDQIYILLGFNECGYPYNSLMKQFDYVINRVHEAQPQARIILHGILHASERVSNSQEYFSVEWLEHINDGLRAFAEQYDWLYYVDCNDAFTDENGYLLPGSTTDGEHFGPEYSRLWGDEILRRAIVP